MIKAAGRLSGTDISRKVTHVSTALRSQHTPCRDVATNKAPCRVCSARILACTPPRLREILAKQFPRHAVADALHEPGALCLHGDEGRDGYRHGHDADECRPGEAVIRPQAFQQQQAKSRIDELRDQLDRHIHHCRCGSKNAGGSGKGQRPCTKDEAAQLRERQRLGCGIANEPAPDETPWRSVHPVAAKQPPRQAHQGDQAEVKTDHGGKPCPDEPELSGQVPDFRTRCRKVKVFLLLFLQKKKSLVLF